MTLKRKTVSLAANMLSFPVVSRHIEKRYGGQGAILMFHGLADTTNVVNKAGTVSVEFFETVLKRIKSSGLEPVRLVDLPKRLSEKSDKRFVVLTFDDGYKSALDLAVPLLEKYQIPATVFVTSGALKGRLNYYWGALEEYLHANDMITIGGMKFTTLRLEQKQKVFREITREALQEPEFWGAQMKEFFVHQGMDFEAIAARDFLDVTGIKALNMSEMVDIGGHTVSHPMLSRLEEEVALEEITQNKKDLEDLLGLDVSCFAYPFGAEKACGEREYGLAEKAGYKVAVTAHCKALQKEDDIYALPRIGVSGRYESNAALDLYLNGGWAALRSFVNLKN